MVNVDAKDLEACMLATNAGLRKQSKKWGLPQMVKQKNLNTKALLKGSSPRFRKAAKLRFRKFDHRVRKGRPVTERGLKKNIAK